MTSFRLLASAAAAVAALGGCDSRRSSPGGSSRTEIASIDPPAAPGAMGGYLAVAGGDLVLTWLEPVSADAGRRHRLRFARFTRGAWTAATTIVESAAIIANWADFPSLASSGDGGLVAHWAEATGDGDGYDVVLARSDDGGLTWWKLGVPHRDGTVSEHGFVSLVPDGAAVRAIWLDGRASTGHGGGGTMGLRSALIAGEIGVDDLLDARVCDCCGTAAAATSDGVLVAYRDRSVDELRDISIVRRTKAGWTEPRPLHADGWKIAGCPVNGPAVAADGPLVAVAWYTYAGGRHSVRLAFSTDAGATFSAPVEVDGSRDRRQPLGRVDVVLDGREAIVSWMASEREDAELLVRRVSVDGAAGEPRLVTAMRPERDSGFPRMERQGDRLAFVWTETAAGRPSRVRGALVPVSALARPVIHPAARAAAASQTLRVGDRMPRFEAVSLDGAKTSLGPRGKGAVLLNVWATWCEPCRHELPELARLHARHQADGLEVIAVSVDRAVTPAALREFVTRRKLPFAVWHDPDDRSSRAFGVSALPVTLLFDGAGALVWRRDGAITADDAELDRTIQAALLGP